MRHQHLVADEVQTHLRGLRLVEKVGFDRLAHVLPQAIPIIALRVNVMGKAFGDVTAITFLRYTKDNFHIDNLAGICRGDKRGCTRGKPENAARLPKPAAADKRRKSVWP